MIVVTGAAGFIGSVLVQMLNAKGREDIICVDRLGEDNRWMNLRGLKFAEFIHADEFLDINLLENFEIEAIYHMGACSDTTERNVDMLMENNVNYSKYLFNYATEKDIPICYASSAATYGAGEKGYSDQEIFGLMPLNAYGYSKQLVDEWVLKQHHTPTKWYGVKFFNVFGPNEYHKGHMSSLVYKGFNQIKTNGEVKLFKSYKEGFEDGEQLRDFVYVKDVCRAMIELIETDHQGKSGIYNLGTGTARSFKDLIAATFHAMNKTMQLEYIEMPEELKNQYQYFTQAEMSKLKHALPDFKFSSLEDAVKDYVQNHLLKENQFLVSE